MVAEVRASQLYLAAKAKFAKDGDVISDVRVGLFGNAPDERGAASVPDGFNAAASLGMIDVE